MERIVHIKYGEPKKQLVGARYYPSISMLLEIWEEERALRQYKDVYFSAEKSLTPNQKIGSAVWIGTGGDVEKIKETRDKFFRFSAENETEI